MYVETGDLHDGRWIMREVSPKRQSCRPHPSGCARPHYEARSANGWYYSRSDSHEGGHVFRAEDMGLRGRAGPRLYARRLGGPPPPRRATVNRSA